MNCQRNNNALLYIGTHCEAIRLVNPEMMKLNAIFLRFRSCKANVAIISAVLIFTLNIPCFGDTAATLPSPSAKTGAFDITFADRSPLSARKELAHRLDLKEATLKDNYDLTKCPFKIYVPTNYDPATPVGILVYLGYKNSVATPPLWNPVLDEHHLIFITPVCHSGVDYLPVVPMWQSAGLALDAVYNLKHQYAIDDKRIYLMSTNNGDDVIALGNSDVFMGSILALTLGYSRDISLGGNRFYPKAFNNPPSNLLEQAYRRAFYFLHDDSADEREGMPAKISVMKGDGFLHLATTEVSISGDLHYPNFTVQWFDEKVLPFLDSVSAAEAKTAAIIHSNVENSTTQPSAASSPSAPSASADVDEAQHLLRVAQLEITNNQYDLARTKLQEILDQYPNDPADIKANQLIEQIKGR